jgi:hypothetical protein
VVSRDGKRGGRLLKLTRNEPCLCGSGRKYKRCCLPAVEEAAKRISRELKVGYPDVPVPAGFVDLLALAVGLAEDEGEIPLPFDAAAQAVHGLLGALCGPDEPDEECFMELHDILLDSLEGKPELKAARFDHVHLVEVLKQVHAEIRPGQTGAGDRPGREPPGDAGPGPRPDAEEWGVGEEEPLRNRMARETVRRLYTPDLGEEWAFHLLMALRSAPRPDELRALVWGVWCLVEERRPEENMFAICVFSVTVEETAAGQAELRRLNEELEDGKEWTEEDLENWTERLEEVLRRYPFLDSALSERVHELIGEALDAVLEGTIQLKLPAWAFLSVLRYLAATEPEPLADLLDERRGRLAEREGLSLLMGFEEAVMDDRVPVVTLAGAALREFAASESVPEGLRESVLSLAGYLGFLTLQAGWVAFMTVYQRALCTLLDSESWETGLPEGHAFRFGPGDVADDGKLRAYAAALQEASQEDAAQHVLWVLDRANANGTDPWQFVLCCCLSPPSGQEQAQITQTQLAFVLQHPAFEDAGPQVHEESDGAGQYRQTGDHLPGCHPGRGQSQQHGDRYERRQVTQHPHPQGVGVHHDDGYDEEREHRYHDDQAINLAAPLGLLHGGAHGGEKGGYEQVAEKKERQRGKESGEGQSQLRQVYEAAGHHHAQRDPYGDLEQAQGPVPHYLPHHQVRRRDGGQQYLHDTVPLLLDDPVHQYLTG